MILVKPIFAKSKALNVIILILSISTTLISGQVSDGDEQFQVIHQDIGRISGGSSSPVAPQSSVLRQQQASTFGQEVTSPRPVSSLAAFERSPSSSTSSRSRQQSHHQQPTKKPNRITLAVRTSAPVHVSLVEPAEPALVAANPARTEPTFSSHHHPSQFQSSSSLLHSFATTEQREPPQPPQLTNPALTSFRASLGHSNSVSARHAALIAQVAAERQQLASTNLAPAPTDFPSTTNNQPSLGSPIEALSAPAVAQVQPPPLLTHQHQTAAAQASPAFTTFLNQPEEPIVAPSFEHILSNGCPKKGVFSYDNKDYCDRYYMCTNGTFTEEACPNGLAYSQMGAVYQHCAYNWNVDCANKKTSEPLASPGCPWQFGIFPIVQAGQCSIDYFVCEWGVPETKRCSPEGLFYDDRIKGCQWADQLGCKSEALLNFKCPPEDEDNPYWPFPRYYHTKQDIIVCVNEQPRLVHCNEEQVVDPSSLACMDLKKKKKKF